VFDKCVICMMAPNVLVINGDQLCDRASYQVSWFTNESPDFGAELHVPQVDLQISWYFQENCSC
jgi:hypothetical protein